MKSNETHIRKKPYGTIRFYRKTSWNQRPHIKMGDYLNLAIHKEITARLDYDAPPSPDCKGQMGKYDFQKAPLSL